jgi:transposase
MEIDLSPPPPRVSSLEEAQALIEALWMLARSLQQQVEAQSKQLDAQARRIELLEEKLGINSRNSSCPPSSDRGKSPPPPKPRSGRKAGAQRGHEGKGHVLYEEADITERHDCYPERRCACGGMIEPCQLSRRHQVVDLPPIKPQVTEYRLYAGHCTCCGKHHEARLPARTSSRLTGPRLLALMGTLTGGYRLSKRQVQGLLQDVFRIEVSVGTISQSEVQLSAMLAPTVEQAHAYVRQSAVVHADETGHSEKGMGQWMWVAIAGWVSVFMARASRSADCARELLGADFAGILVSDRYAAYGWMPAYRRQVCWAHLLRDFTRIAERGDAAGRIGMALLDNAHRMFKFWYRVRDGTMRRDMFVMHMQFLCAQIEARLREGCVCGETRTENTCKQILKVSDALWTFVYNPDVEPTNNLAERTLRSYVIWRKLCFGSQSQRGSLYMQRVMTVVGSCKLQGRNVLDFFTQTVRARFGEGFAPSLIPA